jgi:hypothetical protein
MPARRKPKVVEGKISELALKMGQGVDRPANAGEREDANLMAMALSNRWAVPLETIQRGHEAIWSLLGARKPDRSKAAGLRALNQYRERDLEAIRTAIAAQTADRLARGSRRPSRLPPRPAGRRRAGSPPHPAPAPDRGQAVR